MFRVWTWQSRLLGSSAAVASLGDPEPGSYPCSPCLSPPWVTLSRAATPAVPVWAPGTEGQRKVLAMVPPSLGVSALSS